MSLDKNSLRAAALDLRKNLFSDARAEASENFTIQFLENIVLDQDHVISAYWPINGEMDVRPLLAMLHELGHQCALPAINGRDTPLSFTRWTPDVEMKKSSFGTMEAISEKVLPEFVIVPMLGFDMRGHRLGYGAGHFDRTFAAWNDIGHPYMRIGAAYEVQKLAEVPAEAHDVPMELIVTDRTVYRIEG